MFYRAAMTGRILESRSARGVFVAAVFFVLLLRTLVPSGFMPVEMDGKIVVQLCTGSGTKTILVDIGKKSPADEHKASDKPCTFAGFTGALLPPMLPPVAVPPLLAILLPFGTAIADLTVHRLAAPPPPAIGPPLKI